ncbi:hypothetical protein GQ53DRAFT_839546 [Thozetella sp. PMI_491]|nr:hypothetical protein GQ53DRAFT_839546 [Thozetella sp. PMI_491]
MGYLTPESSPSNRRMAKNNGRGCEDTVRAFGHPISEETHLEAMEDARMIDVQLVSDNERLREAIEAIYVARLHLEEAKETLNAVFKKFDSETLIYIELLQLPREKRPILWHTRLEFQQRLCKILALWEGDEQENPSAAIPFSRDSDFVNRGDILDQIDRRCSEPAGRVALVGLGGVGKSQLAIEYTHRIAEAQTKVWVFWIHAGTQARVQESFRTIADTVKLSGRNEPKADIPLLVQNWLSNEQNGRWIVMLDSADNREVLYGVSQGGSNQQSLASYLPQSRNGSIVVTTRNKDVAYRMIGNRDYMIEVGPMTQADALTLVEKKLGFIDVDIATDLIQALKYVPLAISQATAYIKAREPQSSVGKYLGKFQESKRKRTRLLEYNTGDLQRDRGASNAILTTWQISFDYIWRKRRSAADLLSLMSFFDRQGIPEWVLEPTEETKGTGPAGEHDKARDSDSNSDTSKETDDMDNRFEDDIAILREFCLIHTNREGDEFEMHGLVQLSTRKWLSLHGEQETFKQQYIERIAARFPTGQYENWPTCQKLFLHVQKAVDSTLAHSRGPFIE